MTAWRDDPGWSLVEWARDYWTSAPGDVPPASAELTGGGAWCALFVNNRPVATWANLDRKIPVKTKPKRRPSDA